MAEHDGIDALRRAIERVGKIGIARVVIGKSGDDESAAGRSITTLRFHSAATPASCSAVVMLCAIVPAIVIAEHADDAQRRVERRERGDAAENFLLLAGRSARPLTRGMPA